MQAVQRTNMSTPIAQENRNHELLAMHHRIPIIHRERSNTTMTPLYYIGLASPGLPSSPACVCRERRCATTKAANINKPLPSPIAKKPFELSPFVPSMSSAVIILESSGSLACSRPLCVGTAVGRREGACEGEADMEGSADCVTLGAGLCDCCVCSICSSVKQIQYNKNKTFADSSPTEHYSLTGIVTF